MTACCNPPLYDFVILMCLVFFIPAVAMGKWRENYSADEIQMTHQRLCVYFKLTFFALAALASMRYRLTPLHSFSPITRNFLGRFIAFLPLLLLLVLFPHETPNSLVVE